MNHEGLRLTAYQDSEGVWTIGYGRNLQVMKIDQKQATTWLIEDARAAATLAQHLPPWPYLDTRARQNVFIEMVFNLGPVRLSKFTDFFAAIKAQDWSRAAIEMLDSKWAKQVGKRANTLAELMKYGEYSIRSSTS
jgi:lysozyme